MTAKSYSNGRIIGYNRECNRWIYADTKEDILVDRPCVKCGCKPTKEGYDSCLGYLEGVSSACCGHGVENPFAVLSSGEHLKFNDIENMREYFEL